VFGCNSDKNNDWTGKFPVEGDFPKNSGEQQVTLKPCSYKLGEKIYRAECGQLVVPENWQNENSRHIYLPLMRIFGHDKANTNSAPLVYLSGGPGQSNMKEKGLPNHKQLQQHDYLLLGYRGVDGSIRLDCPEFTDVLPKSKKWFSSDAQRATSQAFQNCSNRHRSSGVDLDGFQAAAMIEDLELMRKQLGYHKLNLLSGSFGTRIALLYAHRYPDSIHRSVMRAANPPGRMVWEASQTDDKIIRLNDYCQQQKACSEQTTDLVETIRNVLQQMPESWLGLSIDSGRVRAAAFGLLYSKKSMPFLVDIFVAAENGDASGLALLSGAMNFMEMSGMLWGDLFIKALSADLDAERDYRTAFNQPESILGSPMSELVWTPFSGQQHWTLPLSYRKPQSSIVETLIISGDLDVSTPPENAAQEIMPYLSNGRQVILRQAGHTDLYSAEASNMYLKFFDTGEVDTSKLKEVPIQFASRFTIGQIIKAVLTGLVLLPCILIWLVWFGYRKLKSRNNKPGLSQ
jgi:pimeloyl-ACP methyl ester carboxylesterase